jgi:hypothetical protein
MASIHSKLIEALQAVGSYNSNLMVAPEVILWPDPEKQWAEVIPQLQEELPQLLVYGIYNPENRQGPAIWIKCMVARMLPEADWGERTVPIIYLPGIARADLRNVEKAGMELQPLLEYQYTGTLFLQENGKEWTVLALVENNTTGMGVNVAKDSSSKDALKKSLSTIFYDEDVLKGKSVIDAQYLNSQLFPEVVPAILHWMCKGDTALNKMDAGKQQIFRQVCEATYDFSPDSKNIRAIAEKLGAHRNNWRQVWQYYAAAHRKFPEIKELLRSAKPDDLGLDMFAIPRESWPQVNEQEESELREALKKIVGKTPEKALELLRQLAEKHRERLAWIWCEMGESPLAVALQQLLRMSEITLESFPSGSIEQLTNYYTEKGFKADISMRKALAAVKSDKDKQVIKSVIQLMYAPWLSTVTQKFQQLAAEQPAMFGTTTEDISGAEFILFVDAFRYELAKEYGKQLSKTNLKFKLETAWSAIPSLTPTAKAAVAPLASLVSKTSEINEFRPQLTSGNDLSTAHFRAALEGTGFRYLSKTDEIVSGEKYWMEIGDIDTKGHEEQSDMVKRTGELFDLITEVVEAVFDKGFSSITIVTDHGWLLLPGGLLKTQLNAGLTETRWGRCAMLKEGVSTDLLHLPWHWNPGIYVAYAPGISFFKANVEYAHGGISIHECLVPTLTIENSKPQSKARIQHIKWVNLQCTVDTSDAEEGYRIDIRTKFNDEGTSILEYESKGMIRDNKGMAMVQESAEAQSATVVLLDQQGIIIDKKLTTAGG